MAEDVQGGVDGNGGSTKEQYAISCYALGVCPVCGKQLDAKNRYGSGRIAEGVCCSLECYANFRYSTR